MAKVRTNIEIEDEDVRAIMDRYGVHTTTEAVALALRHLAGQPMTRDQALSACSPWWRSARKAALRPARVAPSVEADAP